MAAAFWPCQIGYCEEAKYQCYAFSGVFFVYFIVVLDPEIRLFNQYFVSGLLLALPTVLFFMMLSALIPITAIPKPTAKSARNLRIPQPASLTVRLFGRQIVKNVSSNEAWRGGEYFSTPISW